MKTIDASFLKRKKTIFFILSITIIILLNIFDNERVYYLPFNIPGEQMAITIPPFGMFVEPKYKNEKNKPCSVLNHERVHWKQYKRMGLFSFYFNYFKIYLKSGRIHNWMEDEARLPCKTGKIDK